MVDVGERVARRMGGWTCHLIAESFADSKVVGVVNFSADALARAPRKRRVTGNAKHLVAPIDFGDVRATFGALLGVALQFLYGCDVVASQTSRRQLVRFFSTISYGPWAT